MKTLKMKICIVLLLAGMAVTGSAQSSSEWTMLLNNDNSAFKVKIANKEMTFCFDQSKDTLSFYLGAKKALKPGFVVEVILKNNNKVVYTSTEKNISADKTEIIVPMSQVFDALKGMKLPSKPKYALSIKDKNLVKETILFEFTGN